MKIEKTYLGFPSILAPLWIYAIIVLLIVLFVFLWSIWRGYLMNKRELQVRLEALEQYVHQVDRAVTLLESKISDVSVIFSSSVEEKTLQENEREMDEFIAKMNAASMEYDEGDAPF